MVNKGLMTLGFALQGGAFVHSLFTPFPSRPGRRLHTRPGKKGLMTLEFALQGGPFIPYLHRS